MKKKCRFKLNSLIILSFFILISISFVFALPVGPTVTTISNSTKSSGSGTIVNGTGNDTDYPNKAGGFIFTTNFQSEAQNSRWKAYVGNVTGTFVLDDADGYSIYDWSITSGISGEVYAARASSSISWSTVNCSTNENITNEEIAINHTSNPSDNISATFNDTDNSEFYVGNVLIGNGTCPTTNLYVNGSAPVADVFEEVLLHDGTNLLYTSIIGDNIDGYHTNETYDFQMIVPEIGLSSWVSSTAYYFYVELT